MWRNRLTLVCINESCLRGRHCHREVSLLPAECQRRDAVQHAGQVEQGFIPDDELVLVAEEDAETGETSAEGGGHLQERLGPDSSGETRQESGRWNVAVWQSFRARLLKICLNVARLFLYAAAEIRYFFFTFLGARFFLLCAASVSHHIDSRETKHIH